MQEKDFPQPCKLKVVLINRLDAWLQKILLLTKKGFSKESGPRLQGSAPIQPQEHYCGPALMLGDKTWLLAFQTELPFHYTLFVLSDILLILADFCLGMELELFCLFWPNGVTSDIHEQYF